MNHYKNNMAIYNLFHYWLSFGKIIDTMHNVLNLIYKLNNKDFVYYEMNLQLPFYFLQNYLTLNFFIFFVDFDIVAIYR
jgi:hypothetical protein